MALCVRLAGLEPPFGTTGSYLVYTQPPPLDPTNCIPSSTTSTGRLWLRQGPFSPCRKKPKPTNPAFPLYSMHTSPALTTRLFDSRCTHRLSSPPGHLQSGGVLLPRYWSRRRWHCVTAVKSEWVLIQARRAGKSRVALCFGKAAREREKGCVTGDMSSVNGTAGPTPRPPTVVEALQHPAP